MNKERNRYEVRFIGPPPELELNFFSCGKVIHIYDTSQWFMFYSE